jgi:1,4-alpha-glucan branching enzyme
MLLQASDWQFIMFTRAAKDYADERFSYHNSDFNKLCDFAEKFASNGYLPPEDERYLEATENRNSVFPELKLEWWEL